MSTCGQSALRAPCSMERKRKSATLPQLTVPTRDLGLGAGLRCPLHPCLGVAQEPRRRSAARTPGTRGTRSRLPPRSRRRSGRGIQHRPRHLGCCHGESTICCEALPQLPAASPRASLERRLSGRGAGPGAGTTSRPRAPPLPHQPHPHPPVSLSPLYGRVLPEAHSIVTLWVCSRKAFHPLGCEQQAHPCRPSSFPTPGLLQVAYRSDLVCVLGRAVPLFSCSSL